MPRHTPRSDTILAVLEQDGGIALPAAAHLAGSSISTLRRAIDTGELDARYPATGRPIVLRIDLDRWLRRGALTLDQAAVYCGVSRRTLDRIVKAGHLRPRRPSGRPVLLRADLDTWLQSLPTEPTPKAA